MRRCDGLIETIHLEDLNKQGRERMMVAEMNLTGRGSRRTLGLAAK